MPQTFDFFYDLGSPYSYLASTQLAGIEHRTGAKARLLPITLGGLRKATGRQIPPPQQLKYMSEDTARWAHHYGVRMQIPKAFPIGTIQALRACVAADRRDRQTGDDREREVLAADVPGQAPHPPQRTRREPGQRADQRDGEADGDENPSHRRGHPSPRCRLNGFRSLLAPRAVIRDPLRLLDADRLAADEAGLAGAAVDPEPHGAERVACCADWRSGCGPAAGASGRPARRVPGRRARRSRPPRARCRRATRPAPGTRGGATARPRGRCARTRASSYACAGCGPSRSAAADSCRGP